ncbi:hypothetical protein C8F04DRAFT_1275505 [Mycena alexandri]|uniref:DUF6533 domain-containing protein n=1 Tax=Mycena alexandri TaxID=1745969 RepID=A0AAD6WQM4_9AGAR|nr:hypothetical protein C8F04DRAFT_1275505 [Mycena alexandri]
MSTIEIQQQLNFNYYLSLLSFTVLFYDYFLTLDSEVSRYWGSKMTAPTFLFYLNRYLMLVGTIPVAIQYFWTTNSTPRKLTFPICQHLHSYHEYFAVVTQIVIGIMLIFRTYALYERNRRILAFMVTVSAGVIGLGAWSVLSTPTPRPGDDAPPLNLYIGCAVMVPYSQSLRLAAAWGGMGVFDCTVFLLTLYRALSHRRAHGFDLIGVLLRDGSIYFAVIVMANLANILTFVFAGSYSRGLPTTFTNVISSTMVSRLMLNLRDPSLSSMSGRLSDSTTLNDAGMFSTYLQSNATGELDTHIVNDVELEDRL